VAQPSIPEKLLQPPTDKQGEFPVLTPELLQYEAMRRKCEKDGGIFITQGEIDKAHEELVSDVITSKAVDGPLLDFVRRNVAKIAKALNMSTEELMRPIPEVGKGKRDITIEYISFAEAGQVDVRFSRAPGTGECTDMAQMIEHARLSIDEQWPGTAVEVLGVPGKIIDVDVWYSNEYGTQRGVIKREQGQKDNDTPQE